MVHNHKSFFTNHLQPTYADDYFIFKPLRKRGENKSQKLGIIQAVLQTLNENYQNTKKSTTVYMN